jgi:hypothetical protein
MAHEHAIAQPEVSNWKEDMLVVINGIIMRL